MAFYNAKFSGTVTAMFERRKAAWSAQKTVGAKLTVPPELAWWYFQEFGTAGQNVTGEQASETYEIHPLPGNLAAHQSNNPSQLVFMLGGELVTRGAVLHHPGVRSAGFVRKAQPIFNQTIHEKLREALNAGAHEDPTKIENVVLQSMQLIKDEIVDSMAVQLGHFSDGDDPQYGRLKGQKPEDVFKANALIDKVE